MSRYFNILLIIIGSACAIYAEAGERQNLYILVTGIIVLMIGLYRLSQQIPDKEKIDNDEENQDV